MARPLYTTAYKIRRGYHGYHEQQRVIDELDRNILSCWRPLGPENEYIGLYRVHIIESSRCDAPNKFCTDSHEQGSAGDKVAQNPLLANPKALLWRLARSIQLLLTFFNKRANYILVAHVRM